MARPIDVSGQRFGRLLAIEYQGAGAWKCVCDCGSVKTVRSKTMRNGTAQSCGCLHKEQLSARKKTHGMTSSATYTAWINMKARCANVSSPYFKNYGGRGIKVCDRWLDSFENFLEDMGEVPEGMSLDRSDNNGNYEPGNCRWASRLDQMNNRRVSRKIEHEGRTMTIAQWSRELGVSQDALRRKLNSGMGAGQAMESLK